MLLAESGEFLVSPNAGLLLWTALVLVSIPCGVITALKGQWTWLAIGLLTGGLLWILTAWLLPAAPDSWWARRRARRRLIAE